MSNSAVLSAGYQKARKLIDNHILNEIMIPIANDILVMAMSHREAIGHNMTGNTINAYIVAVFKDGAKVWDSMSSGTIDSPLRSKLSSGDKFYAGSQRWDGNTQERTFTAKVDTDQHTEISSQTIDFVNSHKATSKGWEILACNGVEYASFQETSMGIDVLSESFANVQMWHKTFFKPIN